MWGPLARYSMRGPLIALHALGTSPRWGEEAATNISLVPVTG